MGFFSPFSTFEEPIDKSKVIGPHIVSTKLQYCKNCNNQISTHGYEFSGKIKLYNKPPIIGSSVLCPNCYLGLAKSNFIYNSVREISLTLFVAGIIFLILTMIFSGGTAGSIFRIITIVIGVAWFINGFFNHIIGPEVRTQNNLKLASYVSELPKIKVEEVEDLEPHGLQFLCSPRDQVVPCPIAILIHNDNPLNDISSVNLSKIFSGEIKNWNQLGWDDNPITSYAPNEPCRECGAFRRILLPNKSLLPTKRADASLVLPYTMREDRYCIGFALYSHHDKLTEEHLKIIMVDSQKCSYENENYPLWVLPRDSLYEK